jgi:hypothetical protein
MLMPPAISNENIVAILEKPDEENSFAVCSCFVGVVGWTWFLRAERRSSSDRRACGRR